MESMADKAGLVSGRRQVPRQKAAAQPVSFAGTFGLFHPVDGVDSAARRNAAVLFLPPWGFEEMCTHKLFRIMAEEFAADGIASLRFDYPGTGDALDGAESAITLDLWKATISAALTVLKQKAGDGPVMLVGHGLGASLALEMAADLASDSARLCGVVVMAPVVSGRSYLRELQFWSQVIDDGLGLPEGLRLKGVTAIGGHVMPDGVSAALKTKDFSACVSHRSLPHLFVNRPERPGDAMLAKHMASKGARVETCDYSGFDALVANPSMARMPLATMEHVVSWVVCRAAALGKPEKMMQQGEDLGAACLETSRFRESAMRFGRNNRLYGILCEPTGARRGVTVLLVGTAYDRHAGWGRSGVAMARRLADAGVASFRFDVANVGDSPPVPGLSEQVLYAETQHDDVEAALNMLEARELLPVIGAGRCSGGYLVFSSMTKDHRLVGACLANPFVFYWDPQRDVDATLQIVPRSLDTYRKLMFSVGTLRRLIRGDVDVKNAIRNVLTVGRQRFFNLAGLGNMMTARARLAHAQVRSAFERLTRRKIKLVLLYSENDVGLEHVYQHFGSNGRGLARYPHVTLEILPGTDHNFSPEAAQQRYFDEILDLSLSARPAGIRTEAYGESV
ncbi:alpha-beta hydrolase superfamily lysophospholipase [Agrobacterium vitis]|nr:alpha-beta hydrolase superfamily lysophospholipase [Agrobacterium vitis]MBE1439642.1 alpha-beta hydrolase superfamily lysophospholipase [Agrobacterium vitis]